MSSASLTTENVAQLSVNDSSQASRSSTPGGESQDERHDVVAPLGPPSELVSLVQPGVVISETEIAAEIPGKLIRQPGRPIYEGVYSDIARGTWIRPDGVEVEVAIKVLRNVAMANSKTDEERRLRSNKRLKRETRIWQNLRHPSIIPFFGIITGDEPALVSPWCKFGNLKGYLALHPETSVVQKLELLRQTAEGLVYLHTLTPPVFHGDIKPENVLINDNLHACLSDFGLSRVLLSIGEHSGYTTSGSGSGTRGYQSPEILLDLPEARGIGVDIYAFGGLILAVLSGEPPFHDIASGRVAVAVSMGKMPERKSHPNLPANDPIWNLLEKCWSFSPSSRPSMQEIVNSLSSEIERRR
ncbi:hypothetical protein FRB99_004717 [Tulasnella sp. 403]|nr:hypothetical protein FRB99_004717 [Tulasnella sp. 403]